MSGTVPPIFTRSFMKYVPLGFEVRQHRRLLADACKVLNPQFHARAVRHGD